MPRGPLPGIHRGEQRDHPGVRAVGAPELGAVQDVPVALPDGGGPERGRVGAGIRLRQGVGGEELARGDARQVATLLRLGARQEDRVPAERRRAPVRGRRGARPRDLLRHERDGQRADVAAAVGLRDPDAQETLLRQEPHGLLRIGLRLVVVRGHRSDLLPGDRPGELHHHPLLVGDVVEMHGLRPPRGGGGAPARAHRSRKLRRIVSNVPASPSNSAASAWPTTTKARRSWKVQSAVARTSAPST